MNLKKNPAGRDPHRFGSHLRPTDPTEADPLSKLGRGQGDEDLFSAEPRVTAKESETTQDQ